ncbi:MAG: DUF2892 domain-containing protein [Myxococcales bacterium]|nr:DUF2892 domain-containing protein [Myxococcales bacterium]MCB9568942.1 DUF2892 domain-containing protein [Myxococcales bacterium]MCB9700993.1 DUF2892 domain-containing protein [Myxococcales bacterium]
MTTNEGSIDRIIRILVGAGAGYGAFATSGALAIVLGVVAGIMVVTAALGFCPIYRLIGVSTCPRRQTPA